jgi:hypothetical protein
LLSFVFACGGGKDDKTHQETAEIKAACEKLVAFQESEAGLLADLRSLTEVLGSGAPSTVPAQTRCAADLHLYRAASSTGYACIEGCAGQSGYAAVKACFDKCVADDEPLEKARRESRKQREVNARNWLGAASSQATTNVTSKISDSKGREWLLGVDLPDQPQSDGPGQWRIEKTSALVAPTVNITLRDTAGTPQEAALAVEKGEGLSELKQQDKKGRFLLVRVGPDAKMSRAGTASQNRDRLVAQVVYDKDDVRVVCTVQARLIDLDDGLINAATVWTENLCNSVGLKP